MVSVGMSPLAHIFNLLYYVPTEWLVSACLHQYMYFVLLGYNVPTEWLVLACLH